MMGNDVGMLGLELEGTCDCKTVKRMAGSGDFRRNRVGTRTRRKAIENAVENEGGGSE